MSGSHSSRPNSCSASLKLTLDSTIKVPESSISPDEPKGCFNKQSLLATFKARKFPFSKYSKNGKELEKSITSTSIPNLDTFITPIAFRKIKVPDIMNRSCYGALPSKTRSEVGTPLSRSLHQLNKTCKNKVVIPDSKHRDSSSSSSGGRKYVLVKQTESSSSLEIPSTSSSSSSKTFDFFSSSVLNRANPFGIDQKMDRKMSRCPENYKGIKFENLYENL